MKIYFDENLSPYLAQGIHNLEKPNNQGIEVLSIKDKFGRGAKDEDWLPEIGKEGGIIITEDFNIFKRPNQKTLINEFGIGVFFLKYKNKKGHLYWETVLLLIKHWQEITKISLNTTKPFAFEITERRIKQLSNF